jgi:hypothetical protein
VVPDLLVQDLLVAELLVVDLLVAVPRSKDRDLLPSGFKHQRNPGIRVGKLWEPSVGRFAWQTSIFGVCYLCPFSTAGLASQCAWDAGPIEPVERW